MAVLEAEGLSVRLGAAEVVTEVSLSLEPGRVTGLIGPNGAGKTTVLDALSGMVPARGAVRLAGERVDRLGAPARARRGVSRTFQALQLFEDLTVAENLLVAAEGAGRGRPCPPTDLVLEALGLGKAGRSMPGSLTHPERARVALARALASAPSVLLLDEPAAGLDGPSRVALAGRLRQLADEGMAVLLVDHDLALVLGLCDDVVVLDRGRVVATGTPAELASDPRVAAAYLGEGAPSRPVPSADQPAAGPVPEPLLEVSGLRAGYGGVAMVQDVDLAVGGGEVVAVLGLNGAGKTTALLAVSGVVARMGGEVRFDGADLPPVPHLTARRGIAHVPQAPSLFPQLTVAENMRLARGRGPKEPSPLPAVEALARRRAGQLSGGEARMVALARALASRPRLLLVDEMSLGLAPAAAAELLAALRSAADGGTAVVVVEQHPHLALALADRAYVIERGRVAAAGAASEVDVAALLPNSASTRPPRPPGP